MASIVAFFAAAWIFWASSPAMAAEKPLPLRQSISLSGVAGRIDHMAADVKGKRLFVAALGNNTVEVIDLAAGKQVGRIDGLREPQGVLFVPELGRIVVANGGDGTVRFYDGGTLRALSTVALGDDSDNIRYDFAAKRVYVGYGSGALGVLDPGTGKKLADIKLPGHPEAFQLETGGPRIFVNVPAAHAVVVVDREKAAVVASWPLKEARSNFPMALDEAHHRLFIGCRSPARLVVLDTESGKPVASLECVGDVDDIFYAAAARRIYLCGGQGRVDVFEQLDADHCRLVSRTPIALGARTAFHVPEMNVLCVAVPRLLLRGAELRVYAAE